MRNITTALLASAILAFSTTTALAAMPAELKGSWIIDAAATEARVKSQPGWKEEDAASLPIVMQRMSKVAYEFGEDSCTMFARGKRQSFPVVVKAGSDQQHVLEATMGDKVVTLTVTFVDDATIIIRSSATNDMDHYVWKRGSLGD